LLVKEGRTLDNILALIMRDNKYTLPEEFFEQFYRATIAFRFYRVYCPLKKCVVHLNELDFEAWRFALEQDKDSAAASASASASTSAERCQLKHKLETELAEPYLLQRMLKEYDEQKLDLSFLGETDPNLETLIAEFKIDPSTKRPFLDEEDFIDNPYLLIAPAP
jgi:hypothetical protein